MGCGVETREHWEGREPVQVGGGAAARLRSATWLTAAGQPAIDTVTVMLRGNWPATGTRLQRFGLALQAWG